MDFLVVIGDIVGSGDQKWREKVFKYLWTVFRDYVLIVVIFRLILVILALATVSIFFSVLRYC